jgi:Meiotically up-regulated gene 113
VKHLYIISTYKNPTVRFKIGIAADPMDRIYQLQMGNHEILIFLFCVLIKDAEKIEKSLHTLLAPYHIRGEWFEPPNIVTYAVRDILWGLMLDCNCEACTAPNRAIFKRNGIKSGYDYSPAQTRLLQSGTD